MSHVQVDVTVSRETAEQMFDPASPHPGRQTKSQKRKQRQQERTAGRDERRKQAVEAPAQRVDVVPLAGRTPNQCDYLGQLGYFEQCFALGPAGAGKTYLNVRFGMSLIRNAKVTGITHMYIAKPMVEPSYAATGVRSMGALPGGLKEKSDPWMDSIYDALIQDLGSKAAVDRATDEKTGFITIAPLQMMRGRTFRDCVVVLDEAQNAPYSTLKMFLTRMGDNSRAMISGDETQVDLPEGVPSGLEVIVEIAERNEIPVGVMRFTEDDVVRSTQTKRWVKAFNRHEGR